MSDYSRSSGKAHSPLLRREGAAASRFGGYPLENKSFFLVSGRLPNKGAFARI
ncbi:MULTISPECIES: hypothetical protein [unclassified Bradyrhizobium]|jgi:hypothetical protein|uniref:hypothetical protein n=1 Tax=unclassified Bradyrhizobium TaxID=2631580 RepID=UPI001FF78817|nr:MULTISPECIES: hypothetical protein [unclassified Bradyrhizobium]MCK1483802.1 hypothetical protein [Bradyrhizobium sp. 193]MCK1500328.1 hypothetical protein [Bradyrhizobium sp. 188]MCK1568425.1 hypothetical protein [Bradyrhizobium sp. 173]